MLKMRVIPCLDVKDGRVVKGVNFVDLTDAGDPVEQARLYDREGADELCFLDITASHEGLDAVEWACRLVDYGAGEILLTSMDRDGTKSGFDIALTRAIADSVRVPVVASGGVGTLDHLVEGIRDGHATAVLAASIFHFGTYRIDEAKARLAACGIPVRH